MSNAARLEGVHMQRMTKQFKMAKEKVPETLLKLEDAIPLV